MARAATQAYQAIQDGILTGRYPPGAWLREEDLAAHAGVSRTPVREALRQLHTEGLVEILPNRGALVVGWTADDLDEVFDLRLMLEGYVARRATERYTGSLANLEALCTAFDDLLRRDGESDRQRLGQLSLEFHLELTTAAGNRQLMHVLPAVLRAPLVRETFHHYTKEDMRRSGAQHREIIEALTAGDADWAEAAMRGHIRSGRAALRKHDGDPANGAEIAPTS